jgi:hypothetical protein
MRRGFRARADPSGGDRQPSTHVSEGASLVGGGVSGNVGGVGDASVGVEGNGVGEDGAGEFGKIPGSSSHPARRTSSEATIMRFFMR